MKRLIIVTLALAALPLLAQAQNKAIENLAAKYADREGFSTTMIQGNISSGLGESLKVQDLEISKIMSDISSIIMVSSEKADAQFAEDVKNAVAAGNYSTVMSVSADGQNIKFLLANQTEAEKRQNPPKTEFVIMILGKEDNMLVSIVGNYKVKQISKTDGQ